MLYEPQIIDADPGPGSGSAGGAGPPQQALPTASAPAPFKPDPKEAAPAKPEVDRMDKDLRTKRKAARERFMKQTKPRTSGINL